MGIIKQLFSVFCDDGDGGPTYTVDAFEQDWNEYERHVTRSRELLFSTLSDKSRPLVTREHDDGTRPFELLSSVRWKYLPNIRSWIKDEFIPKFRTFVKRGSASPSSVFHRPSVRRVHETPLNRVRDAEDHLSCARENGKGVVDGLHFFLCDRRSTFSQKKSLYGGDCTAEDLSRWYVGGKRTVERNMDLIDESLSKFISFARKEGIR